MSNAQWTVLVLLLVLVALEAGRSQAVRTFFKGAYASFTTNTATKK